MYRYYFNDDKKTVYCVSTYAGKIVKGKASCAEEDEYSTSRGAGLAKARCDIKVAEKRLKNATMKYSEAQKALEEAKARVKKMKSYVSDSKKDLTFNKKLLDKLIKTY